MGQALFKSTDRALGKTIDVTRGAGESLVQTQVEAFKDPVWIYGMATVMGLTILGLISFAVFGLTAYVCHEKNEYRRKRKKSRKKCKKHGLGWGMFFMLLALIIYLIVKAAHMVRNPAATAQRIGAKVVGGAVDDVF